MAVASLALGERLAVGRVEGGEQGGGAVADIVVGDAFDVAEPHGQHRPGALQGLDPAFSRPQGAFTSERSSICARPSMSALRFSSSHARMLCDLSTRRAGSRQ